MILYVDLETYSTVPITTGVYRYAEEAIILLTGWAVDDGPVRVDEGVPAEFVEAAKRATKIVAHSAEFERVLLTAAGLDIPFEKWHCTRARALAHALPPSLADLSTLYKLADEGKAKLADERSLIKVFSIPQADGSRILPSQRPAEWERFKRYCGQDVEACRALWKKLPSWNWTAAEHAVYVLDQKINARGIAVDGAFCATAAATAEVLRKGADGKVAAQTDGAVTAIAQRDRLLAAVNELLPERDRLPDLRSQTVAKALARDDLPEEVAALLLPRNEGSYSAVKKYSAILQSASRDYRVRGLLNYCGASRTGRWSGRLVQPQNLPRPPKGVDIDEAVAALADGTFVAKYGGDAMRVLSGIVRGAFVAAPGHELVVCDLSAIEARVLAWLAGERHVLQAFAAGDDIYVATYSATFGVPMRDVTPEQRQIGKVQVLALGYNGGVGAVRRMAGAAAEQWSDEYISEKIVAPWRAAHPNIVRLWRALEAAARAAIAHPGTAYRAGARLAFKRAGNWLLLRLPSGRLLCYPHATVDEDGIITYQTSGRKDSTYGGKLAENATQAVARDLLAHGMLAAEAAGLPVVLSVHDEIVCEVPAEVAETAVAQLERCMTAAPDWADGLPLAAKGFHTPRYRKD